MADEKKYKLLTSSHNPVIRLAFQLHNSRGRQKHKLFIAEGLREIEIAVASGFTPEYIFFSIAFILKKGAQHLKNFNIPDKNILEIDSKLFAKFAYREYTEGIIGIFIYKDVSLTSLKPEKNPIIVVLESVEKPGNLGAILRTADAAGVDAVIICDPKTDLYNPNVIRASIGCLFSQNIALCSSGEAVDWLRKNQITVYTAIPSAGKVYTKADFTGPVALVFGTESSGLSPAWDNVNNVVPIAAGIKIPMLGKIDSLNVSNSVAIILYEALRQRSL